MENYKEVYFDQYCPRCKHENLDEDDDPCYCCLSNSVNVDSHKPTHFKEKDNG